MQRSTKERRRILSVLDRATKPLTVSEIKKQVGTSVHTATVYRAIEDLVVAGAVRRISLGSRVAHYELVRSHHNHIVCTECGDIEDVHAEPRGLDRAALGASKKFETITTHSLEFFGTCKRCA